MPLISDFEGRATVIAVATPGNVGLPSPQVALVKQLGSLPRQLSPGSTIVWVCAASATPVAPFEIDGCRVVPVRIRPDKTVQGRIRWIQDPFVCRWDGATVSLVVPDAADGVAKETVLQISTALGWEVRSVPLWFEGGNMLQVGDILLLGRDLAYKNGIPKAGSWLDQNRKRWETLEAAFKSTFHVSKVVWVGTDFEVALPMGCVATTKPSWQPLFHLDLFLLPGGMNPDGVPRLFLGELHNIDLINTSETDRETLFLLQGALDEVEAHLLRSIPQVELSRLPIITTLQENRLAVQSLCNGWVEVGPHGRRAYLPDYGRNNRQDRYAGMCHAAHEAASLTLAQWGFRPVWVDMNFKKVAREGGALHCAVKILKRTP